MMEKPISPGQLPLRLTLRDGATFANLVTGENGAAVHTLMQGSEAVVYLWGAAGSGKSHLLQALCHREAAGGGRPVYLDLEEIREAGTGTLEGVEHMTPVCVDRVEVIAGRMEWEEALFHLFNRVREEGGRLVAAGNLPPAALRLALPDLASRLGWGPVFPLRPLDDAGKVEALRLRASGRGLKLPDEVTAFLLRRCPRDMHALFALLDRLDHASLAAKRRLTVPFVRELLEAGGEGLDGRGR